MTKDELLEEIFKITKNELLDKIFNNLNDKFISVAEAYGKASDRSDNETDITFYSGMESGMIRAIEELKRVIDRIRMY